MASKQACTDAAVPSTAERLHALFASRTLYLHALTDLSYLLNRIATLYYLAREDISTGDFFYEESQKVGHLGWSAALLWNLKRVGQPNKPDGESVEQWILKAGLTALHAAQLADNVGLNDDAVVLAEIHLSVTQTHTALFPPEIAVHACLPATNHEMNNG